MRRITITVLLYLCIVGCPPSGYIGAVTMRITSAEVVKARAAWLGLGGFEGPQKMEGGNPNCILYVRRLTLSGASVFVNDCYEGTPNGVTNAIYQVLLINWNEGKRAEVQAEIDTVLDVMKLAIERVIPDIEVTKGAGRSH